jgi:hypothetical protein
MSKIETPRISQVMMPIAEARQKIRDGDLLLFRRRGAISIAGRGEHSHAAKAAWWKDDLFCLEVMWWHGGRAVTLASQVERYAVDGKTLRQTLQIVAAVVAGKVSGAGSGTETFRALNDQNNRVVVTADPLGNRTNVTYP